MPLVSEPNFKQTEYKKFTIEKAALGGINLKDLEYEQDASQSPNLLNMMYRNGSFSKRYGQEVYKTYTDTVYASYSYNNELIVHSGTRIYCGDEVICEDMPEKKGLFFVFNRNIYYLNTYFYQYDGDLFTIVEPYIPDIVINRSADGETSVGDIIDSYNMVGTAFRNTFHGDDESVDYYLTDKDLNEIVPTVTVYTDGEPTEYVYDPTLTQDNSFTVNYEDGKITFAEAVGEGVNNVEIVAYKSDEEWEDLNEQILSSSCYACFGGDNNSRLFLAGGGKSIYYYSEVFDATYFPYNNYAKIGNTEDDIIGMGQQYNILVMFKPKEMYAITYYVQDSTTTSQEDNYGVGAFKSQVINATIGCTSPHTIQLINNNLTWYSRYEGVCTLVSTTVQDERNVKVISRNINHTNNLGVVGIMDWANQDQIESIDYDSKYFLANTLTGDCFVWDYLLQPYTPSNYIGQEIRENKLSWFKFDNFFVKEFRENVNELYYIASNQNKIIKLNLSFNDFGESIHAIYQTPLIDFAATDYLKNVRNVYVQCRGDHSTKIDMWYITEEDSSGEQEQEPIVIYDPIWKKFTWSTFGYSIVNFMNTYRRKCSLKKIQTVGIRFENNVKDCDMSISHLGLEYQIVKAIK